MNSTTGSYAPSGDWFPPLPNETPWVRRSSYGSKPFRFCPHCGELLDQALAPFWSPDPLHETNEARVLEAESEGDD